TSPTPPRLIPQRLELGKFCLNLFDDEAHTTIGGPFLLRPGWVELWCLDAATDSNKLRLVNAHTVILPILDEGRPHRAGAPQRQIFCHLSHLLQGLCALAFLLRLQDPQRIAMPLNHDQRATVGLRDLQGLLVVTGVAVLRKDTLVWVKGDFDDEERPFCLPRPGFD